MPTTNNLYPPIVPDAMPAFIRTQTCRVYFSLSQFNNADDIANVQISVVNQNTNESALKESLYPSGIKLSSLMIDNEIKDDYKYYIQIVTDADAASSESDIVISGADIKEDIFGLNRFYKVQLRFTSKNASDLNNDGFPVIEGQPSTGEKIATWLQENLDNFSEWSKICLIKGIEEPTISINSLSASGSVTFTAPPTEFIGKLFYQNNADQEKETLKSFNIVIKTGNNIVIKSDQIYTDQFNPNNFYYELFYDLQKNKSYILEFNYTTINLYKGIATFNFYIHPQAENVLPITMDVTPEEANGRIKIDINIPLQTTNKNLTIRRASAKTNFLKWEKLKIISNINDTEQYLWYDTSIESGVWYKYRIQEDDSQNAKISTISQPVICTFEDIFLTGQNKQLKIQFNPNVTDFRYNVSESQQMTLGSKFPYVRRNGNNYFRSFSLGGLISALMDKEEWYYPQYQDGYFYGKNTTETFTTKNELYGQNIAPLYETYNEKNNINYYQDDIYEREFRQKVLDFLYENNIKLYRSLTEGNILIKLTNISLQPVQELGRRLYSFSATAIEIDENILEKIKQYNLINSTYYIFSNLRISNTFASGESLIDKFYTISNLQISTTDILKLIIDHNQSRQAVVYTKLVNDSQLFRYVTKNKHLTLYYSDSDPIAECYFYGIHLEDNEITYFNEYYNDTSDITNPINGGVYYIATPNVYKINRYISYYSDAGLLTTYHDETIKKNNNDYILLVEPDYKRLIYYNNNWYLFLDNHDIILQSLSATITYFYRAKKGG